LTADHLRYRVINSGVDGDRVVNGLARLNSDVLVFHPVLTIVELGSNDPGHTLAGVWESQLDTLIATLQAHGSRVILAGLDEPGMGDIYRRVAAQHRVPLVWFTQRVVTLPQDWSDAHHPNGAGYKVVMETFWPTVRSVLGA
jgi:lysophospholipase L1-like esterase